MNAALEAKLNTLPRSPGVYFHKSADGEIIYVGKAAILKNRVRQYFQSSRDMDIKTKALVAEIQDTDWVEVESELDALFLESEMVKRYMPRFNILLRDDKSQMFVRIDMKSEWPTVSFTRNPADDNASYFGPYYNGFAIKKALRYLRRVFPYYTKAPKDGTRPDFDTHLGLSPKPGSSSAEYRAALRRLIHYIEGGRKEITRELEKEMQALAKAQEFEQAAALRNKLLDLRSLQQKIMFGDREFLDISKDRALSDLTELLGLKKIPARIEGYDISHMGGKNVVASMVVFTNGVSDRASYRKFKTRIERNDDYANMNEVLTRRLSEKNIKSWGTPDLILIDGGKGQLDAAIQALESCGATIPIISIAKREEEVIIHATRSNIDTSTIERYRKGELQAPGLVVGRSTDHFTVNLHAGQSNASGHSKNLRASTTGPARYDHVTKLFQRIRDESHRFAVSYHTVLKRAGQTKSSLEDVPGIGPVTRKNLLKKFGSLRGVIAATDLELAALIGEKKLKVLRQHLSSLVVLMLYSSYMTKQAKRQGFTLVELVVTISIIALLATLTVVAYGTWRAETVRTKLKSDLINARTAMEDVRNFNAAYPTSAASTFTASKGVTISGGSTNGTTYCIGASSLEAGYQIRYRLTNTIRDPIEGTC